MSAPDNIVLELAEIKAAIESLDARLKVLEEGRRQLIDGILKMREEDRQRKAGR